MDEDLSDLSSLSSLSPVPSDEEADVEVKREPGGILKFFHPAKKEYSQPPIPKIKVKKPSAPEREISSPEVVSTRKERVASPPREPIFGDSPDIAFIVMFRSRFNAAFPKLLQNFGPQELEKDVTEEIPDVKPGHYSRALEDAMSTHKSQWPPAWEGKNPVSGQANFISLSPSQRLSLLRTLSLWALGSSDTIRTIVNSSYKQNRHNDDLNQPLSVQPWGIDSLKRRYYLVEGLDDTAFRVYREGNPAALWEREWVSVAGSLTELRELAEKLDQIDAGPRAKKLSIQMMQAIPRFEATEEKRRRREYRLAQKDRFKRPEPGFSLYEGRTRGKRIKYTFSDEEGEFESESTAARRSNRNTTGTNTPVEPTGPVTTMSGRQIRRPRGMDDSSRAASVFSDRTQDIDGQREDSIETGGRPRRPATHKGSDAINGEVNGERGDTKADSMSEPDFKGDEDDAGEEEEKENDDEAEHVPDDSEEEEDEFDEDEEMVDDDLEGSDAQEKSSLIITLPMSIKKASPSKQWKTKTEDAQLTTV